MYLSLIVLIFNILITLKKIFKLFINFDLQLSRKDEIRYKKV